MGRLHHLEQTLPANIASTADYPNREFIILNYNSRDGMHEWVKSNLKPWIDKGIVKYFYTKLPKFFVATHAKNIAHRQATGDIICNLDADNFLIDGFADYLNISLASGKTIVASPPVDIFGIPGSCGKIAVRREHFYSVNGYDEEWQDGWGWDDTDFQFRARMQNNLNYIPVESKWCRAIHHSNYERSKNFRVKDVELTKRQSIERIKAAAASGTYIVNQNKNWGFAEDLSIDIS